MYKLRNYIQHCGAPSTILHFQNRSATLEELYKSLQSYNLPLEYLSTSDQEFKLSIYIDRDDIVAVGGKKAWTTILEEVMKQPKEIDIISHVHELNKCINDINLVCILIELLLVEDSQSLLLERHFEIQEIIPDSYSGVLIQASELDPSNSYVGKRTQFREMSFPLVVMKYLEDFRDHIAERCTDSSLTDDDRPFSST